ncbi:MAG TPA: MlaD family protein [Azoarcus sp.]|nr:MlaD family protein [Azoarcus sp.]
METRAHHILIGLFTVLVAGAALLFALWLNKSGSERDLVRYDVAFNEPVSGLSRGSAVEFNGIRVGEVENLRLDRENPSRVFARVRIAASAPVRTDTRARLVMQGVTGLSFIGLGSGNDPSAQPLSRESDTIPIIIATPSPMSRLLADGEDIMFSINEVLFGARELFSTENIERISTTLAHLQDVSGTLASEREEFAQTLHHISQASESAAQTFAEAAKLVDNTNHLVDGELRATLVSTQRSMESLERAMNEVEHLVADNRGNLNSGLRGIADIGPVMGELRATLASLREITRQFEQSPRGYLLGRQPTREFQP